MERTDIPFLSAAELARQIEKKQVSPAASCHPPLSREARSFLSDFR